MWRNFVLVGIQGLTLHPYFSYQCRVAIVTNITHLYSNSITLVTHQEPPTALPLNPFRTL